MSTQYLDKAGLAYFWGKIKAYISSVLPTKTSDLTNDSGFINSPNIPYLTCATAANVAAKTTTLVSGTLPSTLTTGLQVLVKFTNSNSIANPTLAVGSLTAKSIKRYGTTAPSTSATTSWQAGATILFNYDGTYWQMADWTNANTTYSGMTDAEYQAGTSTSNRLITPARLKAAILYHAPEPTSVTVDPKVTSGTNIADITVDGTTVQLYAPSGSGGAETDPIFSASVAAAISLSDVESWSAKLDGLVVTVGSATGSYYSLDASYSTITSALTHGEPVVLTDGDVIYPYVGPTVIDNTSVLAFGISATMNNYTLLQGYLVLPNDLAMYVNQTSQIPTAVSQLTNDSGYITGYTETDPTVPSWAKASTKPTYTASEVGAVPTSRTVNGKALSSNITLSASDVGATSASILPNDSGDIETRYRVAKRGYTNGGTWYFPLASLPVDNGSDKASLIISGRIGGYISSNMSYINALAWNRAGIGIALLDIAGSATNMSTIWDVCDIVIYRNATDNTAIIYLKVHDYFVFDIDLELYQSEANIIYDETYLTAEPDGVLEGQASTSTRRVEIVNGNLLVAGADVPTIVTSGTSNGWTYRKWSDGTLEMWGEWVNTSKTSTSDGGGYISVNATTPPDFPIAFIAKPMVNVSIDCGGQIVVPINMTRPTETSAGSWKGYRVSTNNGTANKYFMFHCIGRWKA